MPVTWLVDDPQWPPHAVVLEDALAAAEHERIDHQPVLVHQVVPDQRAHELRAPDHVDIAAVRLLQRRDGFGHGPASRVELCQPSGSVSVVEATYFGFVFSGSAMTCSSAGAFGQYPAKIS